MPGEDKSIRTLAQVRERRLLERSRGSRLQGKDQRWRQ